MSTHAAHRPKSPLDRFVAWFAIAGTVAVAILSVVGFASHAGHEAVPKAEAADIA
jgi:putative copper export protein